MNKKEFIKTLMGMAFWGAKQGTWARGWDDAIGEVIGIAEELDESQKPTIPQFVADWIEKQMKFGYEDVFISMTRLRERAPEKVKFWFRNNSDTYARAWLDGYEVEKEKKYIVDIEGILFLAKFDDEPDVDAYGETILYNDDYIIELTEKEIKDYDERYWAFAQEVCHV